MITAGCQGSIHLWPHDLRGHAATMHHDQELQLRLLAR